MLGVYKGLVSACMYLLGNPEQWITLSKCSTYIISHYNLSVRIIDLVSHTTYVVCVNFIRKWRDLQLKSTPNDRFYEKLVIAVLIYSQSFCQKSAVEIAEKILFVFCFDVWPGGLNLGFTSNKSTHYLLDYIYYIIRISKVFRKQICVEHFITYIYIYIYIYNQLLTFRVIYL